MNDADRKALMGFAIGMMTGATVMGLMLRKPVNAIIKQDEAYKIREKAKFEYMVETMGPHCPPEVLEKVLEYLQFDLIVTQEEGR